MRINGLSKSASGSRWSAWTQSDATGAGPRLRGNDSEGGTDAVGLMNGSGKDRPMSDEGKFLTVGQVVRGGGPPIDPEEARKLRERASGSWEKYFEEHPALEQAYGRCRCSRCVSDDADA